MAAAPTSSCCSVAGRFDFEWVKQFIIQDEFVNTPPEQYRLGVT
jgi:hypothetical protein